MNEEKNATYRRNHADKIKAYKKLWNRDNSFKKRAHRLVREAVLSGELIRLHSCEKCNSESFVEAHHHNYNRPLEVKWLCRKCHHAEHGGFPAHKKTIHSGESHHQAKLKAKDVIKIKKLLKLKHYKEIAAIFGVSDTCIRDIKSGRRWKSL